MTSEEKADMLEGWIQDELMREDPRFRNAKCTVCREVWVDVLNGEDTCADCLRKS